MRLLRLISSKPTGSVGVSEFENYFNDNIILKANSKIGLLNASVPINYKEVHITTDSNQFQFKTADTYAYHDVDLGGDAVYDIQDFLELLKLRCYKMLNKVNDYDNGFAMKFILKDAKVNIKIFRAKYEPINQDGAITVNKGVTYQATAMIRANQGASDNASFLYSRLPALLSCTFFNAKVTTLANMILGLTRNLGMQPPDLLDDDDFKYAIKIDVAGGLRYYYYHDANGVPVQIPRATVTPTVNDWVALEINQGVLYYKIYQNAGVDPIQLAHFAINQSDQLHVAIGLRETNVRTSYPRIYYDPFFTINALNEVQHDTNEYSIYDTINEPDEPVGLGLNPPTPASSFGNIIFTLNFNKEPLQDILGFNSQTLRNKGQSTTFSAHAIYNSFAVPATLLVELLNIKLNSYDGLTGSRRNIVAVIPGQNNSSSERLLYSTPAPMMLDVDNQFDINMRSIRVRIVSGDDSGSLLDVFDRIELTLLIS